MIGGSGSSPSTVLFSYWMLEEELWLSAHPPTIQDRTRRGGSEPQKSAKQNVRLHTPNQPVPSLKCGAEPWETQEEGREHLPSIRCPSCCPISLDSVSEEGGSTGLSANTPVVPTFEAGSRPTSPCCPVIWPEPLPFSAHFQMLLAVPSKVTSGQGSNSSHRISSYVAVDFKT